VSAGIGSGGPSNGLTNGSTRWGSNAGPARTAVQAAERAKVLRMVAYFVAGLCSLIAIGFFMSLGRDVARGELIDARRIFSALAKATLSMTIAFWVLLRLLRHENEQTARGRKVIKGARSPGPLSAAVVAVQCLVLSLALMAAFEVSAQTFASEDAADQKSSGAEALERARREAGVESGLNDENELSDRSDPGSNVPRRAGGLLDPNNVSGTPSSVGTGMGNLLSDEPTLLVRTAGPPKFASVHLRGFVLDQYGSDGILRERSSSAQAMATGPDGWVDVETAHGPLRERAGEDGPLELEIEFIRESNGIIFAPAHLLAVQTRALSFDSGLELWRIPEGESPDYRVRSDVPAWPLEYLSSKRSRRSVDEEWLTALPQAKRKSDRYYALRTLGEFAQTLTEGCTSDLDSVLSIVSYLRNHYGYELYDTSFLSPERCVELIERGSGSCSHFASLAAILLRARAIPVRIAVGYVAQEPLEGGDGWLVRSRDGHAWIEVHFEGLGWLPFDATPGDMTAGGAVTGWAPVSDSERVLAAWTGERMIQDPARTTALGEWVAEAVRRGARSSLDVLAHWTRGWPGSPWAQWIVLGGAAALGAILYLRRLAARDPKASTFHLPDRQRAQPIPAHSAGIAVPPLPEARALMEALESRNLAQGKAQTPTQFARGVELRHPESSGLLRSFLALLGRASTQRPLSAPQTKELAEVTKRLRSGENSTERSDSVTRLHGTDPVSRA
jgi:transglutaminase-like putative cysteine protease